MGLDAADPEDQLAVCVRLWLSRWRAVVIQELERLNRAFMSAAVARGVMCPAMWSIQRMTRLLRGVSLSGRMARSWSLTGQLDARFAQVVALRPGSPGSSAAANTSRAISCRPRLIATSASATIDIQWSEPSRCVTGAKRVRRPGGDLQVGDVCDRLVGFVAQAVGAQFVGDREHELLGVLAQLAAELGERPGLGAQ